MRLRQTAIPGDRASWRVEFYEGHLNVVNGIVETDKPHWIEQLRWQGFTPIADDEEPQDKPEEVVKTAPQTRKPTAARKVA